MMQIILINLKIFCWEGHNSIFLLEKDEIMFINKPLEKKGKYYG